METNYNKATPNRPEGRRPLDGPAIHLSLPDYIRQLKGEVAWEKNDRNAITLLHSEKLRLVLVAMHEAAEMKQTVFESPIAVQILEGRCHLETGSQTHSLDQGEMMTIAENQEFLLHAESEVVFLLTLPGQTEARGF